jgi:hypothetical protein
MQKDRHSLPMPLLHVERELASFSASRDVTLFCVKSMVIYTSRAPYAKIRETVIGTVYFLACIDRVKLGPVYDAYGYYEEEEVGSFYGENQATFGCTAA